MSASAEEGGLKGKGLQFSDKDEHMYFWFPLLAGLSELTFDPRPDIRYSALEVGSSIPRACVDPAICLVHACLCCAALEAYF